ncbi:hypothetical protein PR202_ga06431 [Eleusine coracana subsp. coracana]|uniref:Uncharacterized protein n=1 Tax=Eleusine coracana subsp. coracana TaxID=191504 RepID=A0AAV5BYG3_ELECO|nr:hypothetical protein PR202_ga06431 [Eleusine coracana subsp. coracana]
MKQPSIFLLIACFLGNFGLKSYHPWALRTEHQVVVITSLSSGGARLARKLQRPRESFNTLIILGAWIIWKHRNSCVFDGTRPSVSTIMREFENEKHLWSLAGARSMQALLNNTNMV